MRNIILLALTLSAFILVAGLYLFSRIVLASVLAVLGG